MYDSKSDRYKPWEDDLTHWKHGRRIGHHPYEKASPSFKKYAKRAKGKANRRAEIPQTQMRGYGWGRDNYRYAAS